MENTKDKPVVISAENYAKKSIFKYSLVNPKVLGLLTVLLLLVGGVGAGVYLTQTPKQTVTQATSDSVKLSFQPPELSVDSGSVFNIDIFGDANGNQITGVKLALKYDQEILELTSISPKQFLPKILADPEIASGSASISLGTDGNSGISGSGVLATLRFKAKAPSPASTKISFEDEKTVVNILGSDGNPVTGLVAAQISISSGDDNQLTSSSSSQLQDQSGFSQLATSSSALIGEEFDFNSDAQINSIDLSLLYSAWGEPETEAQKKADINGDGVVNGLDYSQFLPKLRR